MGTLSIQTQDIFADMILNLLNQQLKEKYQLTDEFVVAKQLEEEEITPTLRSKEEKNNGTLRFLLLSPSCDIAKKNLALLVWKECKKTTDSFKKNTERDATEAEFVTHLQDIQALIKKASRLNKEINKFFNKTYYFLQQCPLKEVFRKSEQQTLKSLQEQFKKEIKKKGKSHLTIQSITTDEQAKSATLGSNSLSYVVMHTGSFARPETQKPSENPPISSSISEARSPVSVTKIDQGRLFPSLKTPQQPTKKTTTSDVLMHRSQIS